MDVCKYFYLVVIFIPELSSSNYDKTYDIEQLLFVEHQEILLLKNYVQDETHKLAQLNRILQKTRRQHEKTKKIPRDFQNNPINVFSIISRLWKLNQSQNFGKINRINEKDVSNAAKILISLQQRYDLNTKFLIEGKINGIKVAGGLNAEDCFELGRQAYYDGYYKYARIWIEEAREKLPGNSEVMKFLILSCYKSGNISLAQDLKFKFLEQFPGQSMNFENVEIENSEALLEDRYYGRLCRGEIPTFSGGLCCYFKRNNPFLFLAPVKVEEIHQNPEILMFHEVLSDREIESLQILASPKLEDAMVVEETNTSVTKDRISKITWFFEENDEFVVNKINRRIADITGLSLETAEPLQIASYDIGGHFSAHYDFFGEKVVKFSKMQRLGDRVATVLFYMNDVAEGGATGFPEIGVTLWPKKGAAAFWYNLFPDGREDPRTLHLACPVLMGSKWVSNKWIHERGQEGLRPCLRV